MQYIENESQLNPNVILMALRIFSTFDGILETGK
jgi:hypothetical protein